MRRTHLKQWIMSMSVVLCSYTQKLMVTLSLDRMFAFSVECKTTCLYKIVKICETFQLNIYIATPHLVVRNLTYRI